MRIKDYIKRLFEENNKKLISNINTNINTKTQLVSLESYYSEEEKIIGKWINGKLIYQKTFNLNLEGAIPDYENILSSDKYTYPTLQNSIITKNSTNNIDFWYACKPSVTSKATLLWSNSSETSSFSATFVSIPECANYNAVLISCRYQDVQASADVVYCLGFKNNLSATACEASSNRSYGMYRTFTMKNNGVEFGLGDGIGNASFDLQKPNNAIPLKIYGMNLQADMSISVPDIDKILSLNGYEIKNDIMYTLSSNDFIFEKDTNIIIIHNVGFSNSACITLKYTKTTDSEDPDYHIPDIFNLPQETQLISLESYYSEQEQVIGRWTDGKPIYQKTMFITSPSTVDDWVEGYPIGAVVDKIIKTHSELVWGGNYAPNCYSTKNGGNGDYICVLATDNSHPTLPNRFGIKIGSTSYTSKPVMVTIQYTKVGDTTNTQFTLPALYKKDIKVNYSLEEQIIGTWIDGKPIYQKTIIETVPSSLTNRTWDIPHGINDLDIIIDKKIIIVPLDHSWYSEVPYVNTDVPNINRNVGFEEITQSNIRIKWGEGNSVTGWNGTLHATILYTKTTDTVANISQIPNLYDISRPDMWPENQEIYFGNKLYGYRYVEENGNHTVNAKTSVGGIILTNINIHHIVAQGGEIIGPDWNMPIGVHSNDFPIDCYYWVDHTNSALKTSMENAHTQNFIWTGADAWVTYIKE